MILLYADDPGGCNYLAPIAKALQAEPHLLLVAAQLAKYAADRGMMVQARAHELNAHAYLKNTSLLIVGTSEDPDCYAHHLVEAARREGVPSIGVVDMNVNADRRFRGRTDNPLAYAPDWLAVSDELTAQSFSELGFPAERLLVCGHPHFDEVRARKAHMSDQRCETMRERFFPSAPPGRPIWMFLAEGVDQLNPAESHRNAHYTLAGRGGSDFRGAIVLEEILNAARDLHPRPWVVLRLHPKSHESDFSGLAPELGDISRDGDPLPLIKAADLVIGMSTMLLVEAYLLGCPHLSVLPRESERHWLFTLERGLTPVVSTRDSLREALACDPGFFIPAGDELPFGATTRLVSFVEGQKWRQSHGQTESRGD